MPKKSNVEMEGLLERAYKLHETENLTHKQIAELFRAEGFCISASGVQRALRAKKQSIKEFETLFKESKAFVEATKNTPGTQILKAAADLAMSKLLTEIKGMENLSTLSDGEVLDKMARVGKAQVAIAKLTLDYEKGYKAGLFKAQEALEKAEKGTGTPEEKLALLKKDLLGLSA